MHYLVHPLLRKVSYSLLHGQKSVSDDDQNGIGFPPHARSASLALLHMRVPCRKEQSAPFTERAMTTAMSGAGISRLTMSTWSSGTAVAVTLTALNIRSWRIAFPRNYRTCLNAEKRRNRCFLTFVYTWRASIWHRLWSWSLPISL